jgi:hypothetical protein
MEESAIQKLIFDFRPQTETESSRKRSSSVINDDAEGSKRIRKQLQEFDLSSDTSSMDTDDDDDGPSTSYDTSKNSSVSNVAQESQVEDVASTSKEAGKQSPNVNIISVDIIKPAAETADTLIEIEDENDNEVQIVDEADAAPPTEETAQRSSPPKPTNRIVISDSSDEEEEANSQTNEQDNSNNNNGNRRHSDVPYSSAYSYANVDGNRFESRASFNNGRHHHSHRFSTGRPRYNFNHSFEEQSREFRRRHAENMENFHQNLRTARDHATRAVHASASAIPDLLSTFRDHFQRPLFRVADINQNIFGRR